MLAAPVRDLASASQFHVGLILGAILTGGTLLAVLDRRPRPFLSVGGLFIAVGFGVGVAITSVLPVGVALGLLLLAAAGYGAERISRRAIAAPLLALPGAVVLATTDLGSRPSWVALVAVLAIVLASPLVSDFDRRYANAGWPLGMYAISVVGVYFTVPDTERALVLLGVVVPIVFLGWPVSFASLGPGGSYAACGVLVWVSAFESRGRESAFIGALACLGLLIVEPMARFFGRGRPTMLALLGSDTWSLVPVAVVQVVLVFVASRIAGLQSTVAEATVIAGFEMTAAVVVLRTVSLPARS
jgi:hypothetical protein